MSDESHKTRSYFTIKWRMNSTIKSNELFYLKKINPIIKIVCILTFISWHFSNVSRCFSVEFISICSNLAIWTYKISEVSDFVTRYLVGTGNVLSYVGASFKVPIKYLRSEQVKMNYADKTNKHLLVQSHKPFSSQWCVYS